ncbi:MAG: NAD(P)H-binding protein [Myxococcota bacterium]
MLLTGATGFVGQNLYPALVDAGYRVRCASRNPERAAESTPERTWVELDVEREETLASAMDGCNAAFYLIHQVGQSDDYGAREVRAAERFREAAAAAGVGRVVYLGGVEPDGPPSHHLESRLETGRALRGGDVSTIELRAAMIIGEGSASWRIVRDVAARLPAMLLPSWSRSKSEPVAVSDVVAALIGALERDTDASECWDIPGPEALSGKEVFERAAAVMGNDPLLIDVPLLTPKLSSYWLRFVTRSDYDLAKELVEGLEHDLLAKNDDFWHLIDHPERLTYDQAAARALKSEGYPANGWERVIGKLTGTTDKKLRP